MSESLVVDDPISHRLEARQQWLASRREMEMHYLENRSYGGKSHRFWKFQELGMRAFLLAARIFGFYERGHRNAHDLVFRRIELSFPTLPPAFDGYTILHLSDLHLDGMPGLEQTILRCIDSRKADLCVLTGDYRLALSGEHKAATDALRVVVEGLHAKDGFVAILGNHDDHLMVPTLEAMGIQLLINEHMCVERSGQTLQLIGTDDVHFYYTDAALAALEYAREHFTIALIHSPELFDRAQEMGVQLYLCGHVHGGQIVLPGGRPVMTHLDRGHQFFRGFWRYGDMQGITSTGVGTSGIPLRFNTRGEILQLVLRRSDI